MRNSFPLEPVGVYYLEAIRPLVSIMHISFNKQNIHFKKNKIFPPVPLSSLISSPVPLNEVCINEKKNKQKKHNWLVPGLSAPCPQFGWFRSISDSKKQSIHHSSLRLCFPALSPAALLTAETLRGVPTHTCLLASLTATGWPVSGTARARLSLRPQPGAIVGVSQLKRSSLQLSCRLASLPSRTSLAKHLIFEQGEKQFFVKSTSPPESSMEKDASQAMEEDVENCFRPLGCTLDFCACILVPETSIKPDYAVSWAPSVCIYYNCIQYVQGTGKQMTCAVNTPTLVSLTTVS